MKYSFDRRGLIFQVFVALIGGLMIATALVAGSLDIISYHPSFRLSRILLLTVGAGMLLSSLAFDIPVVRWWFQQLKITGILRNLALVLMGSLVGLLLIEGGLRLVEGYQFYVGTLERIGISKTIPDPKLGVRLAPYASGHDARGFRNDSVPDQVEIVAIGDSQTYGISASRADAWPQTLARLSDRGVYNMGLGYYGPVQYWVLIEEALELSPEVIIVGIYFGNDLWGAYSLVYSNDHYRQFREIERSHELLPDTVSPRAQTLWDARKQYEGDARLESNKQFWRQVRLSDWSVQLVRDSAIGRLLFRRGVWPNKLQETSRYDISKAWAQSFPEQSGLYENGNVRTVFTTAYRLLALDLDEPRIAEGLRITKELLLRIQARTGAADTKLLVLLIPTKEMVYGDALKKQQGQLDPIRARLVEMESRARTEIVEWCVEHKIECLDGLPVLAGAVERNEQIYPSYTGGHPIATGYYLLASAVNETLARLDW